MFNPSDLDSMVDVGGYVFNRRHPLLVSVRKECRIEVDLDDTSPVRHCPDHLVSHVPGMTCQGPAARVSGDNRGL